MKPNLKWTAVAVGSAGIVAAAFVGERAWAGGIPPAGALNYSGLLQDSSRAPLSGTQYVEVKFWNDVSASAAANLLCDTGTPGLTPLTNGRFSLPLPDKCTTQVGANTGIWAEVIVGSTADAATSLGRAKIGAVPFAVEANHAVNADNAANATGPLATQLSQLQGQVHPASAFHGWTTTGTIPSGGSLTAVVFDHVDYDLGSEYTKASGVFKPKADGYYLVICQFEYFGGGTGIFDAVIVQNGGQVTATEISGADGFGETAVASTVVHLAMGDSLSCDAYQSTGAAQTIGTYNNRTAFTAARIY